MSTYTTHVHVPVQERLDLLYSQSVDRTARAGVVDLHVLNVYTYTTAIHAMCRSATAPGINCIAHAHKSAQYMYMYIYPVVHVPPTR